MFNIEEELKKLPAKPGVYLMHDKKDAIIYVGKAQEPRATVFSKQPSCYTKDSADDLAYRSF